MKKFLLTTVTAFALASVSQAVLVSGYDFQTAPGTVPASSAASTSSPLVYTASFGGGSLYLDGTNGSSLFVTGSATNSANEVSAAAGTAVNAGTGFATTTTSPSCLSLIAGSGQTINGKSFVFTLSTTGLTNLILTYAASATSTGPQSQAFAYSTNGTAFTAFSTVLPPLNFATQTVDFSSITALNNLPTVYIRATFSGASASTGSDKFDNIQFNAVPEPSTYGMIVGGAGMMIFLYRRKKVLV